MSDDLKNKKHTDAVSVKCSDLLAGVITISRPNSNVSGDYINIEIKYNKKTITAKMTVEVFGRAVTGLARQPIEVEAS